MIVDWAIDALNRMFKADPAAVSKLVEIRVPCNRQLAEDPACQVGFDEETQETFVGLLGVLNGIFGADADGNGFIAGVWKETPQGQVFDGFCNFQKAIAAACKGDDSGHRPEITSR